MFYPWGISLRGPWNRKFGGQEDQSGCCGVKENPLPLSGIVRNNFLNI
jgi:hypothetical protein